MCTQQDPFAPMASLKRSRSSGQAWPPLCTKCTSTPWRAAHSRIGLYPRFQPKMAKVYGNAGEVILNGLKAELSTDYADYKYKYYYYFSSKKADGTPETPSDRIRAIPELLKSRLGLVRGWPEREAAQKSGTSMAFRSLRDRFRRGGNPPPSIVPDPAEGKKASIVRASVFFIAVTCLIAGILYQMGVLHFAMPPLDARKIQHRGESMQRENRIAAAATGLGVDVPAVGQAEGQQEPSTPWATEGSPKPVVAAAATPERKE